MERLDGRLALMAYLVVLIQDNEPFDAGDIISWRPEGSQNFGLKMIAHPWFRTVHVSNMTDAQAEALCAPQVGDPAVYVLKQRAQKVDLTGLTAFFENKQPLSTKWDPVTQTYLIPEDLSFNRAAFMSAVITKPMMPVAITAPENVIG